MSMPSGLGLSNSSQRELSSGSEARLSFPGEKIGHPMAVLGEPIHRQRRPAAAFERDEIEPVAPGPDDRDGVGSFGDGRSGGAVRLAFEDDIEHAVVELESCRERP